MDGLSMDQKSREGKSQHSGLCCASSLRALRGTKSTSVLLVRSPAHPAGWETEFRGHWVKATVSPVSWTTCTCKFCYSTPRAWRELQRYRQLTLLVTPAGRRPLGHNLRSTYLCFLPWSLFLSPLIIFILHQCADYDLGIKKKSQCLNISQIFHLSSQQKQWSDSVSE